jgi:hypothetical protein
VFKVNKFVFKLVAEFLKYDVSLKGLGKMLRGSKKIAVFIFEARIKQNQST